MATVLTIAAGGIFVASTSPNMRPSDSPTTRQHSYILGERIAGGGMAEVFLATSPHRRFDTPIVVKRMLPHLASNRDFVNMFVDEARISTRLDHPNIVKVYDFEATDRGLSLVMEFINGPDLLAIVKRVAQRGTGIPAEHAVFIACHILEALDYAHLAKSRGKSLGIVHRDVSPSNILLTGRGLVKLADFGIARATERQHGTANGTLKGKYGYMSPEQIASDEIDGRSDLFSVAIVLAEMLMGRRLFTAPSDLELLLMVRRGDLTRLDQHGKHIPEELLALLRKGLAADRSERFQSAAEMRDELSGWLARSPKRTNGAGLARYISSLEKTPGDLCRWASTTPSQATLTGPATQLARDNMRKAAQAGRSVFALGASIDKTPHPVGPLVEDRSLSDSQSIPKRSSRRTPDTGEWSLERGDLASTHPLVLLTFIGKERLTGLLTVKNNDFIKELYFTKGNPDFVRSNVHSDRFGQFLVARKIITKKQLSRVLATLPHFNGKMGEALVELKLLKPVDAVRHLSQQIAHKMLHLCTWDSGLYSFREGIRNEWPARSLKLRTHDIVNAGLRSIPIQPLRAWATRHRDDTLSLDQSALESYGFNSKLTRMLRAFTGENSLGTVLEAVPASADRRGFITASYLLSQCRSLTPVSDTRIDRSHFLQVSTRAPTPRTVRKYPRVSFSRTATLEMSGRPASETISVEIASVTCKGLGLVFSDDRFYRLRKGERARLRFNDGRIELIVEAQVAWCAASSDSKLHFGLALQTELMPASMREAYANWAVARIHEEASS